MWVARLLRTEPACGLRLHSYKFTGIRRNGLKMFSTETSPTSAPLVVVMGTTGTGKSDLAVEIARRFNGEVINADAMQMYQGLPIITNKITPEEQRGVPHHLLGIVGLEQPTWNVHRFRREAGSIIREIRSRGRLPVLVGGTHYYLDGLLFDNNLVIAPSRVASPSDGDRGVSGDLPQDPALTEVSTETLLARLREVDPVSADRWHPKNRRKILRSLEIYLSTGRRASDIYAEQVEAREAQRRLLEQQQQSHMPLFFWVHSDRAVLYDRLDRRVGKMLDRGLIAETRQMHAYLQQAAQSGIAIDRTTGIWQSIGFSEIEPYLDALHKQAEGNESIGEAELDALKLSGVELIKHATGRYAKGQIQWITHKTLPLIQDANMLPNLFLVDGTDITRWSSDVVDKAVEIADLYLGGRPLPEPAQVSASAGDVLAAVVASSKRAKATPCNKTCQLCQITAVTEEKWVQHIKGNRHRRAVKAANKKALVAAYLEGKAENVVNNIAS